ncbi:NUDIX domain-containing protein [Heyndrickxia acidicola]|uniref:NUDIX domain-containing protein n=1 Tax=Heyndrickxia acidicola TaxID=209389 RepID=A0ABU6MBY8_9BACI|nr:NUDIX domain-containing protein [Heyndrickxia acidicola]MED1201794.1 NUDIX domain-containing protein [Heyndrickxia acidicola]
MNEYESGKFHHVARAIIQKGQSVLLLKADGYSNSFLPGGHIEFGESAKMALPREIEEELGVKCEIGDFLGVCEHQWEESGQLHCELNQLFAVTSDELDAEMDPPSREGHLHFFWCHEKDLLEAKLEPSPLAPLIQQYIRGSMKVWWESTLRK